MTVSRKIRYCSEISEFSHNFKTFSSNQVFTVLWKNEKFTVTHKKFRQINSLVFSLVKTLLSRNFCQRSVTVYLRNFHTGNHRNSLSHFFDKNFVKVTFLPKKILKS